MSNVDQSKFMSFGTLEEQLNDDNNVGVVDSFEPGPVTLTYHDVASEFRWKLRDDIGDEDSRIFVASDQGELSLGYGPHFDATIVTNLKRSQLRLAFDRLRDHGDSRLLDDVTIHFDHAGPLVFESDGLLVVTTPARFPWDFASHDRPRSGPCGPTIRGGNDEVSE